MLTLGFQGETEDAGCAPCVWVVLTQDAAAAGEGIIQELAGL